jgi:DHA3 family macrolide efflux protein-like MFS transporter
MSQAAPVPSSPHWAVRFFTIWIGQSFSLFGSAIVQFALVWWLTQETGSAIILTTATLAGVLPQILLGPFAGALVDRWDRRLIMILADGAIAVFTLVLIWLFATGGVQVWHIYVLMAVRSLGGAFHFPAMAASTPLMVPEQHLTRVSGINQTLMGLLNMIAPPIGALLIDVMPTERVLMIDIGTAALAIAPLLIFSIPQPERQPVEAHLPKPSLWADVHEGLRYLSQLPGLLTVLAMVFVLNFLLTPTGALAPLLITRHFGKGAFEFGLFDSAWGLGMIAGGLLLGIWGGFRKKVATSMMGIIGIGVGISMVAFAPEDMFWLALVGMTVTGITNPLANGPLMALLQSIVRPDMQGRVMSLVSSFAMAMTPLGLIIAGPVTEFIGLRSWYWIAGIVTLLMGVAGFFIPAVIHLEENQAAPADPLAPASPTPIP